MIRYLVVDLSTDGCLALLLDADERVHVVRFQGRGVECRALLIGRRAKLGAHVLVAEAAGKALHARFEFVDCSQHEALSLMHPVDSTPTVAPLDRLPTRPVRPPGPATPDGRPWSHRPGLPLA